MLIRNIMRTAGISAAAMSLCACSTKFSNKNTSQNDTIRTEVVNKDCDTTVLPLTSDYLGMRVVYNSKEDSTRVNDYINKIVKEALPIERRFDRCCDAFLKAEHEKLELLAAGDSAGAAYKEQQMKQLEPRIDSLWTELSQKTIHSDSVNKYAKESDLEPNKEYLYGWFKQR